MNDHYDSLKMHIERFPSSFDRTSIAQHLVKICAPVSLYAEIRDVLWNQLANARRQIGTNKIAADLIMETVKEMLDE